MWFGSRRRLPSRAQGVPRLRNRRGATLVVVAMFIFVLVGMAAIAIDFARAYMFKNELQRTADAAAMGAVMQVMHGAPTTATTFALAYRDRNKVNRATADMTAADVEPGVWDMAAGTFTPVAGGDWTDPSVNAVRTTGRYDAPNVLAQVFGSASLAIQARAVGAVGYVGPTDCLKPWAVSYQSMLDGAFPPAGSKDASTYDLTKDDIDYMTAAKTPVTLLMDNSDPVSPGNIAQVITDTPWNGNSSYKNAIYDKNNPGYCPKLEIGPGTWLDANPGQGSGQSAGSVQDLCGVKGNPDKFSCNVTVKLAIWDYTNDLTGSNLKFHVKYIGVFTITSYDRGNGKDATDQITGHFTSMPSDGTFSNVPSPLKRVALVQ